MIPSPCMVLSAGVHHKNPKVRKYKGRLEYLNRGDPFADKTYNPEEILKQNKEERKQLPNYTRAYLWGNAEVGALGQPGFLHPVENKRMRMLTVKRPFASTLGNYFKIKTAACGYGFTLFATDDKDKQLWGTGLNDSGQIGNHRRLNGEGRQTGGPLEVLIAPAAVQLPDLGEEKVASLSAGRAHSLVLTTGGRVLSLGNNGYGQCGRGVVEAEDYLRNRLVHMVEVEKVKSVQCGQDHSLMVTEGGEVFSCGWGADGQTGLGHYRNTGKPCLVGGDLQGEKVVKVACAADCVLALSDKGEVFGWGNSEYGQLSSVTPEQQICHPKHMPLKGLGKVVDIASGGTVCMVLNEEGKVYVWGYGILGKGPNLDNSKEPTEIPEILFGRNTFSPNSKVVAVYCGLGHQAAVTNNGDLYVWGKNRGGCLGLNTEEDRFFPLKVALGGLVTHVSMGVDHMVAVAKPWMSK